MSLMRTGAPSTGPFGEPLCQRRSAAFAATSALSSSRRHIALSSGSLAAIWRNAARVTSTGENLPLAYPLTSARALSQLRSLSKSPPPQLRRFREVTGEGKHLSAAQPADKILMSAALPPIRVWDGETARARMRPRGKHAKRLGAADHVKNQLTIRTDIHCPHLADVECRMIGLDGRHQ